MDIQETCRWDASSATSKETKSDRQLRAWRAVAGEDRALTTRGKRAGSLGSRRGLGRWGRRRTRAAVW